MKKSLLFFTAILILSAIHIDAYAQRDSKRTLKYRQGLDFPEVPRASAYEAYVKYKTGKAIIIQAGGEVYKRRHILGALEISQEEVRKGEIRLPKLPRKGIEIFTYCY